MTQWSRAIDDLAEDPGLVPSIHMATHKTPISKFRETDILF